MKMQHPATSVLTSLLTQLHPTHILFTTKHTWPLVISRTPSMPHLQSPHGLMSMLLRWKSTEHCSTMTSYHQHQTLHPTQAQQNSSLKTPYQHIKDLDHHILTTGYLTVVPHVIIHPFSAIFVMLKPATSLFHLLMELPRSQHSKEPLTATSPLMKDKSLSLA